MTDCQQRAPRSDRVAANGGAADACVVIPMFNEATVIGDVVRGLRSHLGVVVCVDDGSTDDSAARAAEAGAVVLRHAVNLGQGASLQTALDYVLTRTDAAYVVTFDADGQHDPRDAVRMLDIARTTGVDVVLGSRFLSHGSALDAAGRSTSVPLGRRLLLRAALTFTRLTTGLRLSDTHNGLRVLSRAAASQVDLRLRGMAHASELLHHIAAHDLRFVEEPVEITYTEYSLAKGQSSLNALNIAVDLLLQRMYAR